MNFMLPDVRLVDEEGTPMSTPNTSGDDESGDEVGLISVIYFLAS